MTIHTSETFLDESSDSPAPVMGTLHCLTLQRKSQPAVKIKRILDLKFNAKLNDY